jgi:outer membrane lipoprotein-sorting protein
MKERAVSEEGLVFIYFLLAGFVLFVFLMAGACVGGGLAWAETEGGKNDREAWNIIARADDWRQGREGAGEGEALRIDITLKKQETDGGKEVTMPYRVWARGRRALVEMKDKKTFGQRVLMDEQSLWLYTPKSKRLIRVNPLQRLMGDASYGDIGLTRWTLDYDVFWDEEREGEWRDHKVYQLVLEAKDKRATYTKMKVKVDRETGVPLYAEAYVRSGKKLKEIEFGSRGEVGGREIIRETIFRDVLRGGRQTVMEVKDLETRSFRDVYYTKHGMKSRLPE